MLENTDELLKLIDCLCLPSRFLINIWRIRSKTNILNKKSIYGFVGKIWDTRIHVLLASRKMRVILKWPFQFQDLKTDFPYRL